MLFLGPQCPPPTGTCQNLNGYREALWKKKKMEIAFILLIYSQNFTQYVQM